MRSHCWEEKRHIFIIAKESRSCYPTGVQWHDLGLLQSLLPGSSDSPTSASQRWGFTMLARLVSNSQPQEICLPWPPKVLRLQKSEQHTNISTYVTKKDESEGKLSLSTLIPLIEEREGHVPRAQSEEGILEIWEPAVNLCGQRIKQGHRWSFTLVAQARMQWRNPGSLQPLPPGF
ncbi:hypothetical protein AAY473_024052, partial [Plecturocebus cupreus]